ncbi:AfsR/SARP family transcriptional regulator [Streptomyces sp. ISL-66]|uniref:AfsR/SARP family transcriptional regulator n=1 Tax=Streptomyces sp. ISL-66 TaxID=2819186 RepID=UPI001BED2884|nr:AfsR/SARP family transcriptional regulator [Streptomyces sp. ISL-66]MBT2469267.1 AfsR/SARP family transcriptional regulator [Streptomyces sp. ISL-66]
MGLQRQARRTADRGSGVPTGSGGSGGSSGSSGSDGSNDSTASDSTASGAGGAHGKGGAGDRPGRPFGTADVGSSPGPGGATAAAGPDLAPSYLVLGPLEVRRGGVTCTPSPLKRRALLAILLLHANRLASADMLIDELWDGHPPRSALATLQMYVSGLRRTLDPGHGRAGGDPRRHPVLRTTGSGYLLEVGPGELDLDLSRARAALGRHKLAGGDCAAASEAFAAALAMWRGRPLADLGPARLPEYYTARLDEERLALVHDRIGADICAGRSQEVVAELAELCARHPLREAFHEQLMLALAGTGRRAEALDAYARARRVVVAGTGVEPGPDLQAVQRALLGGLRPSATLHGRCHGSLLLQPAGALAGN